MSCVKCLSSDIVTRYTKEGELIDSSSLENINNEFIISYEYEVYYKLVAKKEHLSFHCRNCHYEWCENTKDKEDK